MTTLLTETARELTTRLGAERKRQEGEKLRPQVLRSLVWTADVLAGVLLSAWAWVRETLEGEGFEGRELAGHCRVLLDGIDESLTGYEQFLVMAEEAGLTPEAAGLEGLQSKLPALRDNRPKVAAALELATRPPRPIDETKLAESRTALDRGEFVAVDEYLARLRAGEDV
jgi:hypothetical protein